MKKLPFFSIVIVNYNHGEYLDQAIQSILSQSFGDYELIIVDGGSTDNSLSIINENQNLLAWWVSEKDKGQSDAFNKGFSRAKGEYFLWLNADDLLLPDALKVAENTIKIHPEYKWFSANTIFFNRSGSIIKCSVGPRFLYWILKHSHLYIYGPTSIFHRSLFDEVKGFNTNLNYTMDTDLWLKFFHLGYEFYKINSFFWGFRIHLDSKTSHAFTDKKNTKFQDEIHLVYKLNNHSVYIFNNIMYRIQKIFFGAYLKSLYFTFLYRFKYKNINNI